jgi:predicted enzyme related to lactoylglutathione lyase
MAKGEYTHIEIPADDVDRASKFYAAVFGWEPKASEGFPDYSVYRAGEVGGGIGKRGKTAGNVIRNYITVNSLDEGRAAVEANGGTVAGERVDLPGMGSYLVVHDTEGNEIALWEDAPHD